jgi:hypothetical protein
MGYEVKGNPAMQWEEGSEFATYVNAFIVEGEVIGGVYDTQEDALEAARALILELGALSEEDKTLGGMDAAELQDRINEQDVVGFAQVAQRDVLFS